MDSYKNSKEFENRNMGFDKFGNSNLWYYEMSDLGYNYRITDIQAALGNSQLKKVDKFINQRRKIAKIYDKGFSKNKLITTPKTKPNIKHAYHLYTLMIDFQKLKKTRNELMLELKKFNIGTQVLYIPVHLQPYYSKNMVSKLGIFLQLKDITIIVLAFQFLQNLKKEVEFIIEKINSLVN